MMLIIFRIENYDNIGIIVQCEILAIQIAIYSLFFVSVFQILFIISHNICIIKGFMEIFLAMQAQSLLWYSVENDSIFSSY